jgi:uncharacterized membrane protein AbrB (regulator of aidB expression)
MWEWRKLHNEELHNLYSVPIIIIVVIVIIIIIIIIIKVIYEWRRYERDM